MFPSKHKGTLGHAVGASIIGKDQPPGTGNLGKAPPAPPNGGADLSQLGRMEITGAANGVQVSHTPFHNGESDAPYPQSTNHVFTDPVEAHAHIGRHLGIGATGTGASGGGAGAGTSAGGVASARGTGQ